MTNWEILAIPQTQDRDLIKQAYMALLPRHNPEDDPEGFLRLRTAYEEILKSLDTNDSNSSNNEEIETPQSLFRKEVEAIYRDFTKRCDLATWKALLEWEICQRLDMVDEAEHLLLEFLLSNFYLPMDIWAALSVHFDWPNRAESLKQTFPPQFIDYVIKKSIEPEHPKYSLFAPSTDKDTPYDQWITLFLEMDAMINAGQIENPHFTENQQKLEAIPLQHPYYSIIQARIHMYNGEYDKAMAILEPLRHQHPDDMHIWFYHTTVLTFLDRSEEALAQFEKMLEQNPDFADAGRGILNAQIKLEDYEAADATMMQILQENPYDYFSLSMEHTVCEGLIELYETRHNANPEDIDTLFALAKYLVKNRHVERCRRLLGSAPHLSEDTRYKERQAMCHVMSEEWAKAAAIYEDIIKTDPKLYIYGNAASALINMEHHAKALEYMTTALELYGSTASKPDKTKLYIIQIQATIGLGRYNAAMKILREALTFNSMDPHLCTQQAQVYQHMGNLSAAMDYSEKALSIFPFITDTYIIQIEIYHRQAMYDRVLAVAARAEVVGYESPKISCHKAEALRMLGEYDQALAIMETLVDAEFDEGYRDSIYTEMAQLMVSTGDIESADMYINKAIEMGEYDVARLAMLANIRRRQKQYDVARVILLGIMVDNPEYIPALIGMGNISIDMGDTAKGMEHFEAAAKAAEHHEPTYDSIIDILMGASLQEEALDWTIRRFSRFESLPNRIYVAIMHGRLGQNEEAEAVYKMAIKQYPDAADGPRYYGLFLQNHRRYNEAIPLLLSSIELAPAQLDLYEALAYCYQEEKAYNQAIAILDKAEKTEAPYNLGALAMRRGTIYEDMLNHKEALEQMLKAAAFPDKLDGEWQLSWVYTRIGLQYAKNFNDAAKAMEYFTKALDEDENCIDAVDYMGDIYLYAHKDYEKALECYNKKIDTDPTDPHTYVTRALAYTKLKRYAKAKRDYKTAINLFEEKSEEDPSPCWQVYIANCMLGLKDINASRAMFEKGLETPHEEGAWCNKPICDVCLYSLGKISEMEKDYDKALEYYNRALEVSNSVKHNAAREDIL